MAFDTTLRLHNNVPIADGLQIAFPSINAQQNFFFANVVLSVESMVYLDYNKGYVIVDGAGSQIMEAGYLSFQNFAFDNKTFYARIVRHSQVTMASVRIEFVVDYWQTFMFDAKYRSMMISREHISAADQTALEGGTSPHELDIIEFATTEDLPITRDLEILYKDKAYFGSEAGDAGWTGGVDTDGMPVGYYGNSVPYGGWSGTEGSSLALYPSYYGASEGRVSAQAYVLYIAVSGNMYNTGPGADKPLLGDYFGTGEMDGELDDLVTELFTNSTYSSIVKAIPGIGGSVMRIELFGMTPAISAGIILSEMGVNLSQIVNLLTERGYSESILGIHAITDSMITKPSIDPFGNPIVPVPNPKYQDLVGYEPQSHKLYRSPFRMVRMVSPGGEEHALAMENFSSDGPDPSVVLINHFEGSPSTTLVPVNYNGEALAFSDRMVYGDYVQLPYSTDAYLTYYAAALQSRISTMSSADRLTNEDMKAGNAAGRMAALNKAGGGVGEEIARTIQNIPGLGNLANNVPILGGALNQMSGGESPFSAIDNALIDQEAMFGGGDPATSPLAAHRNAHIVDNYNAGNQENSVGSRFGQLYWRLITTSLRAPILKAYDEYFLCYGYRSQRLGIPRILDWTQGGDDAPHFVEFDGFKFTYIQTESAKVYDIYQPAAEQISGMLNAGVRMIDGSTLIAGA